LSLLLARPVDPGGIDLEGGGPAAAVTEAAGDRPDADARGDQLRRRLLTDSPAAAKRLPDQRQKRTSRSSAQTDTRSPPVDSIPAMAILIHILRIAEDEQTARYDYGEPGCLDRSLVIDKVTGEISALDGPADAYFMRAAVKVSKAWFDQGQLPRHLMWAS
jgi:hypothetical protein